MGALGRLVKARYCRAMAETYSVAPALDDLERLADAALKTIPDELRRHTQGVVVRIAEFPDAETGREMDLESPFDLLGLYRGVSLDRKGGGDTPQDVDMVFLYRRPILDYWCETGEDLGHLVRHVIIHEIGHHFGLSDDAMQRIEDLAIEDRAIKDQA